MNKIENSANKSMQELLQRAKLRVTEPRLNLAAMLFSGPDRHVSAEQLFLEAQSAGLQLSLATVYNTLASFKAAGLLRELAIEGKTIFYDTNTSNHFHFYHDTDGHLTDIEASDLKIEGLPALPAGKTIDRIDVIIRLK